MISIRSRLISAEWNDPRSLALAGRKSTKTYPAKSFTSKGWPSIFRTKAEAMIPATAVCGFGGMTTRGRSPSWWKPKRSAALMLRLAMKKDSLETFDANLERIQAAARKAYSRRGNDFYVLAAPDI